MRTLSLFTGIGGGELGMLLLGMEAVGYVEWTKYCQRILRARIDDGILAYAPIFGDIRTFVSEGYAGRYRGMVDIVTAGFPCQPFSVAGKRRGVDDERNMWPATLDVIREVGSPYVLLENVPGLLSPVRRAIYRLLFRGKRRRRAVQAIEKIFPSYFGRILGDLAEAGYDAEWLCLSCAEVGGPQIRDRVWILAYAKGATAAGLPGGTTTKKSGLDFSGENEGGVLGGVNMRGCGQGGSDEQERYGVDRSRPPRSMGDVAIEGGGGLSVRPGRQDEGATYVDGAGPWGDAEYVECAEGEYWAVKPGVRLLVDGFPGRVAQVRGAGNGWVPAVVLVAFPELWRRAHRE